MSTPPSEQPSVGSHRASRCHATRGGVAVDLNVGDNPRGSFSTQDPRLVEVMRAHGFTWGGTWLVPDPAHHEVVTTEEW
ncbi:hypothetical protein BH23ACT9_BH23ACT9_06790 [soil metagenome]